MSKRLEAGAAVAASAPPVAVASPAGVSAAKSVSPAPPIDHFRETVEAIVIALVLAFLFKTFEAEMFVIPTGSMAPTLRGLHKDVPAADGTHYWHAYGMREGTDPENPAKLRSALSPLYGCPMPLEPSNAGPQPEQVSQPYSGDRILVSKLAYTLGDPKRWDVVVFKCPAKDAGSMNYIKRLIGEPGETVRVHRGDVWIKPAGGTAFEVMTKPDPKAREMRQIVFDSDYAVQPVGNWPPERFETEAGSGWKIEYVGKNYRGEGFGEKFELPAASAEPQWLRYVHTLPTPDDWSTFTDSQGKIVPHVKPRLVTDFCPYNSGNQMRSDTPLGLHWVGDLWLEADVDVTSAPGPDATVLLELVAGGESRQARFKLADGTVELFRNGKKIASSQGPTPFRGTGKHQVGFSDFDAELRLRVDGKLVEFDAPLKFDPNAGRIPNAKDLRPAGIAGQGVTLSVRSVRVWRDIYYIAANQAPSTDFPGPFEHGAIETPTNSNWAEFYSSPEKWERTFANGLRSLDFPLEQGQYFVMGDNSSSSEDARFWDERHFVRRDLFLGKALFIYWPHGWETPVSFTIPSKYFAGGSIRVPFYPNFGRMKFIR